MGMDVYGKVKDESSPGHYFRNNVWWWRNLADYIETVAPPELYNKCEYWQSNDGAGLNAEDSKQLAEILRAEIESGRTLQFDLSLNAKNKLAPDVPCWLCAGTGKRQPPPNLGAGTDPCNSCNSTGLIRPPESHYPFSEKNVKEFAEFLEHCGGFEIW